MIIAWVRKPSAALERCELSFLARAKIDVARACEQHAHYVATLAGLGCTIRWLPALEQQADGVFVEDTAVVVPERAVITRPGAPSRRDEVATVASALAEELPLTQVSEPATLEGGDVLRIGRRLYVGRSLRSNREGVAQLAAALAPEGYSVGAVALRDCLHLKSAVTWIAPQAVLLNPAWVDRDAFGDVEVIEVDAAEPFAANTLTVAGTTLVSADYPRTRARLERRGIVTRSLDVHELHKAEAALTCLSLILERT